MAHVSLTTQYRKDLDAAEVDEEASCLNPEGVNLVGEFSAYVRCFTVIPGTGNPALKTTKVWTGEQDGSVAQRLAWNGDVVSKDGLEVRIGRKPQTFVYCMVHVGQYLWCGLSDGYVRWYDTTSLELLRETRRHVGAINTMLFAGGYVFTGGNDFQVLVWDVQLMKVVGQYSGSQNHVKALAYDGVYLYSAGDDKAVRSWNVASGTDRGGKWPVLAHSDGIRALVASKGSLFTGAKDGFVKRFDISEENVLLVNSLHFGAVTVTSLILLEISKRLLVGSSCGNIFLIEPDTFEFLGVINAHRNTMVSQLVTLCQVDAVKIYTLGADNVMRVFYSESDAVDPSYMAVSPQLVELQQNIETTRSCIIENNAEIEKRKATLTRLNGLADHRKEKAREALRSACQRHLNLIYYQKLLAWLRIRRNASRRKYIAECLMVSSPKVLHAMYYSKLLRYTTAKKKERQRKDMVSYILNERNRGLRSLYFRNCLEYLRRLDRDKKRTLMAQIIMPKFSIKGLRLAYYKTWKRWTARVHHLRKCGSYADLLTKQTEKSLITIYFKKLIDFYKLLSTLKQRELAAEVVRSNISRGILLNCYNKFVQNYQKKKEERNKAVFAATLFELTDYSLYLRYFMKWTLAVESKKDNLLTNRNAELLAQIAKIRKSIEECSIVPDGEIEQQLADVNDDIGDLEKELKALEARIAESEAQELTLQRDVQMPKFNRRQLGKGVCEERVEGIMRLLKQQAVLCGPHKEHVAEIREMERAKHKKPASVVSSGLSKVRAVLSELPGVSAMPNQGWKLNPTSISSMSNNQLKAALIGIREMVVSWDCMIARHQTNFHDITCMEEIAFNGGCLLNIVTHDWNLRTLKNQKEPAKVELVLPGNAIAKAPINIIVRLKDSDGKRTTVGGTADITVPQTTINRQFKIFFGEARESIIIDEPGTYTMTAESMGFTATARVIVTGIQSIKILGPSKAAANSQGEFMARTVGPDGKSVSCSGPLSASVNGTPVMGISFDKGEAKIPVTHGGAGTTTITVGFSGVEATQRVDVVEVPKVIDLEVEAVDKVSRDRLGYHSPFDVTVYLVGEGGARLPNCDWGTVSLKAVGLTSTPANVIDGKASFSATFTADADGETEVVAVYKDQRIQKTFSVFVDSAPLSPRRPLSPRKAKTVAPQTAVDAKPWTGFEIAENLLVKNTVIDGPANKGGILVGDKILAVNGDKVTSIDAFRVIMKSHSVVGKRVKFQVSRAGRTNDFIVTIGDQKDKK